MKLNTLLFKILLIVFSSGIISSCNKNDDNMPDNEPKDILERLESIPGIIITEINAVDHFSRLFEIRIEQPVDHNQPGGATFSQKIYLGHVDIDLPVAFETEGYSRSNHKTRELSGLLNINQLTVEHRYYGESVPEPMDWEFLDIWQTAQDHHRIVTLFKELYPASWVSSGASKGGDAAIFHRRFFPQDVNATVAYVAPILFEATDQRFLDYYNTAGDEICREKMKNFQRNMLMNLDSFPPLFEGYVNYVNEHYNTNLTFSIPYQSIVYHATREDYAFEFWSSETENCTTIPGEDATIQELFDHFVAVFDIFLFFSDYGVDFWTPWLYQAKTELGNYAYDDSYLQDLIMPFEELVSFPISTNFDPTIMQDIDNWIQSESTNMIFIYGEKDPWTAAAVNHSGSGNVVTIINPGTKHGTRISDLSKGNQDLVIGKLNLWLGL